MPPGPLWTGDGAAAAGVWGGFGCPHPAFFRGILGRGPPQAGGCPYACRGCHGAPRPPPATAPNEQQKGAHRERMC